MSQKIVTWEHHQQIELPNSPFVKFWHDMLHYYVSLFMCLSFLSRYPLKMCKTEGESDLQLYTF